MKFSEPPYRLSQLPSAHLDDTTVTMQWALGFARVRAAMDRNAHFREWSEKNQKGGDFMVLSNVHRVRLPSPCKKWSGELMVEL